MYVIIMLDGCVNEVIGPFDTLTKAGEFAKEHKLAGWMIMELSAPEGYGQ